MLDSWNGLEQDTLPILDVNGEWFFVCRIKTRLASFVRSVSRIRREIINVVPSS